MDSQIISEVMNFYDEKIHFLIESVNVDMDNQSVSIFCDTTIHRNKCQVGRLIGRKGIHILGLQQKIQDEFGDSWTLDIVTKD